MATATTNTVLDHTSDAGFRAWVAEFIGLIDTGGALVDTGDTGQINTATVNRPAVNTNAGYIVRRFNDSLQSTAPYFVRFDFGTQSAAGNFPRVQVTIGTGSNGAGTITGAILSSQTIIREWLLAPAATAYPSYACGHPGSLTVACKVGALDGVGWGLFGMHRTRDWGGSQTGDGLVVYWGSPGSAGMQAASYRRVSPMSFGPSAHVCLIVQGTTTSARPGGNPAFYRHFAALPDVVPVLEYVTVAATEMSAGATETARPVGGVDRTYLCLGAVVASAAAGASTNSHHLCMLYD